MNFDKPTLITITAPTCSGKTFLIETLQERGYSRIVGFTTRPPRDGEVNGKDYYFISRMEAQELEDKGLLAETAEFRGNRYGVTHEEMAKKMTGGDFPPVLILEPQGLQSYIKYCADHDFGIFKVYVSVTEQKKLDRLNTRTVQDLLDVDDEDSILRIVKSHTDRTLSITGDERTWLGKDVWDAIVPGDDLKKAIDMIEQGIEWRNKEKGAKV
jgi:guanylate kinase